ncbi:hypothetical protein KI659_10315 [Litoribacter alkaliphilus]|uniref:Lipoprotein n=1 Tax=Litoribacter ruber TaxID=702568 RepID=A0AAP2CIE0_9BACT|nr:hypothetical protein [Litoribacter alkaliphilus]MBS9524410.1 hypothetical protein [Litoribacter alkaliphilus]
MRSIIAVLIIGLSLFGCTNEDNAAGNSLIQDGDGDGSFNINKVTHGDTPIWLVEKDLDKLEKYYSSIETLDDNSLKFKGHEFLNLGFINLENKFNLRLERTEGKSQWFIGDGIQVYKKDEDISSYLILKVDQFLEENKVLGKSIKSIQNFKQSFPVSYSLRNQTDPYLMNFSVEDQDIVYDYAYLHLENLNKNIHFRWIDGELIQIVIE